MKNSQYLLERRMHGTVDFPCAIYQAYGKKGSLFVKHHWHTNFEILYLKGGRFKLEIDMESRELEEEMFVFINPQELHSIDCTGSDYEERAVVFDLQLLNTGTEDVVSRHFLQPLELGAKAVQRYIPADSGAGVRIKEAYMEIMHTMNGAADILKAGEILRVKASLFHIFAVLEEENLLEIRQEKKDYRVEYVKTILNYIREHYNSRIKICDMAEQVGMNEQYFCRFFKKMLGKTPVEYLNEYRIERAKEYLLTREDSIMAIAMDCGFFHMGNFIEMFKKMENCTPSHYRKSYKKSK